MRTNRPKIIEYFKGEPPDKSIYLAHKALEQIMILWHNKISQYRLNLLSENTMRGSIDYNVIVEIPEEAHVCSDQRIYIVNEKRYCQQLGYNMDDRVWIGKAVSDHTMHPNDNYKERYRDSLQSVTHLNLPEYTPQIVK